MVAGHSLPRNLRFGLALLALIGVTGLLAPLLATSRPWLARTPQGLTFPALRSLAGLRPSAGEIRVLLPAPIPHDPDRVDLGSVLTPPSWGHWLGTDGLGRDLAARIVYGARVSLAVGLLAALLALAAGVPLGAAAGYAGGWVDWTVSRVVEAVLCFPALVLALALLAAAPPWLDRMPDVTRIALVLGVTGWVPVARYLRGEFLRIGSSEVVTAARAAGAGHGRIVLRHILPAALAPVLVTTAFVVAASILAEAALSFLGLGVRPPIPTWGGLLTEARTHIDRAWWLALFPGLALFLAILACNLVGEGIGNVLNPRARRGR